jgi:hypothetical protein
MYYYNIICLTIAEEDSYRRVEIKKSSLQAMQQQSEYTHPLCPFQIYFEATIFSRLTIRPITKSAINRISFLLSDILTFVYQILLNIEVFKTLLPVGGGHIFPSPQKNCQLKPPPAAKSKIRGPMPKDNNEIPWARKMKIR